MILSKNKSKNTIQLYGTNLSHILIIYFRLNCPENVIILFGKVTKKNNRFILCIMLYIFCTSNVFDLNTLTHFLLIFFFGERLKTHYSSQALIFAFLKSISFEMKNLDKSPYFRAPSENFIGEEDAADDLTVSEPNDFLDEASLPLEEEANVECTSEAKLLPKDPDV